MGLARILRAWRGGRERRREARRVEQQLIVDSPAVEVELIDSSDSGLGIEAARRLRIGVLYPFRLRHDDRKSLVYGLVRWCEPAGSHGYRAGVSVATPSVRSPRFAPLHSS